MEENPDNSNERKLLRLLQDLKADIERQKKNRAERERVSKREMMLRLLDITNQLN